MPIEFFNNGGEMQVRESFISPTVYFDHWAIREFSDDISLQDRFVEVMLAKGGTFVLSHINIAEFTHASDPRHADATEKFLERLMPNVYLTDFDYKKAEEFENQPNYAGQPMWPSADLAMLKFVAERSIAAGENLTLDGYITLAHTHRDRLSRTSNRVSQNILDALNKQRNDPAYVKKARQTVPDTTRTKTRVIMGELMRELTIDSNATITLNDINDWLHAILSVSCCNYVLLDSKWEQRVKTMTKRIKKQGLQMSLAKCFSKRENGLCDFLSNLEAF